MFIYQFVHTYIVRMIHQYVDMLDRSQAHDESVAPSFASTSLSKSGAGKSLPPHTTSPPFGIITKELPQDRKSVRLSKGGRWWSRMVPRTPISAVSFDSPESNALMPLLRAGVLRYVHVYVWMYICIVVCAYDVYVCVYICIGDICITTDVHVCVHILLHCMCVYSKHRVSSVLYIEVHNPNVCTRVYICTYYTFVSTCITPHLVLVYTCVHPKLLSACLYLQILIFCIHVWTCTFHVNVFIHVYNCTS
jgi:hypothetical protein